MKTVIACLLSSALTALLVVGVGSHVEAAQSANPRADLVTGLRQDVGNFFNAMQSFKAHRQEKISNNVTFVSGDLIGNNNTGTYVAGDMNQMVTDFNTCVDAVQAGGTISVGVWTNVIKVK